MDAPEGALTDEQMAAFELPPGALTDEQMAAFEQNPEVQGQKFTARITTYPGGGQGSDPDTDAGRSSTGSGNLFIASPGMAGTAAVNPKEIPYGSIILHDGKAFVAADTGSDVVSRKASKGKHPVVDLYKYPDGGTSDVHVLPPVDGVDYQKLSPAQKTDYHKRAAGLGQNSEVGSQNAENGTLSDQAAAGMQSMELPSQNAALPDGALTDEQMAAFEQKSEASSQNSVVPEGALTDEQMNALESVHDKNIGFLDGLWNMAKAYSSGGIEAINGVLGAAWLRLSRKIQSWRCWSCGRMASRWATMWRRRLWGCLIISLLSRCLPLCACSPWCSVPISIR